LSNVHVKSFAEIMAEKRKQAGASDGMACCDEGGAGRDVMVKVRTPTSTGAGAAGVKRGMSIPEGDNAAKRARGAEEYAGETPAEDGEYAYAYAEGEGEGEGTYAEGEEFYGDGNYWDEGEYEYAEGEAGTELEYTEEQAEDGAEAEA
jgi:hypothetical protein